MPSRDICEAKTKRMSGVKARKKIGMEMKKFILKTVTMDMMEY
jgi:hypothetical protein